MRIHADTDVCIGSGQCVLTDPTLFDQSEDDGTVVVLAEQVPEPGQANARLAVGLCPSGALSLTED